MNGIFQFPDDKKQTEMFGQEMTQKKTQSRRCTRGAQRRWQPAFLSELWRILCTRISQPQHHWQGQIILCVRGCCVQCRMPETLLFLTTPMIKNVSRLCQTFPEGKTALVENCYSILFILQIFIEYFLCTRL